MGLRGLIRYLTGCVPTLHDWPHRSLDGRCQCRCTTCVRVRTDHYGRVRLVNACRRPLGRHATGWRQAALPA
ncbi:MAG: hypothetical protein A2Y78_10200 [Acidobacteria bacterium RBG_13_68_16]|nr:MAG: hypothetical protein A2Y78_10200 [Acidobacteria bacterium RBG_13_68_16]